MLALAAALYRVELAGKRIDATPARAAGAARMTTAEKYVPAAYLVVLGAVLAYLVIIALKVGRLERELAELARAGAGDAAVAELLFWPALLAYGEAAVAYAGDARHPGRARPARRRGACGSAGSCRRRCSIAQAAGRRRLPLGHVGRLAQPLRLARRRRRT